MKIDGDQSEKVVPGLAQTKEKPMSGKATAIPQNPS
jgi:hypothetical protein